VLVRQRLRDLGGQPGQRLLQRLDACAMLGLLTDVSAEFGDEPLEPR